MLRSSGALNMLRWSLIIIGYWSCGVTSEYIVETYYSSPGDPCLVDSEVREFPNAVSVHMCAIHCATRQCQGFFFEDGNCTLGGSLEAPSINMTSRRFQRTRWLSSQENIALGKSTESSEFLWALDSSKAVDGEETITDHYNYYFHSSAGGTYPWWFVDLGENRMVKEIHVMPYGYNPNNHRRLFMDIEIRTGKELADDRDFSSWDLFAFYPGPPPTEPQYLVFSSNNSFGFCGRYVSIQKTSTNPSPYVSFNEVKVFALEKSTD